MGLNANVRSAKRLAAYALFSFVIFTPEVALSQWVFVARHAVGRIEQVTQQPSPNQPPTEVTTVILDAPAQRIFDVAINTIQTSRSLTKTHRSSR